MWKKHLLYAACALVLIGLVAALPAAAAAGDPFVSVNAAPVGDIDVEAYVSIDGGTTWIDADDPAGPILLAGGAAPQFRYAITNVGDANLNSVTLTDSVLGAITVPSTLAKGATGVHTRTGTWAAGQYTGTATATGKKGSVVYTDSDAVHYFGAAPAIDVEKYVSVDGGATWDDADAAPGPELLQGGPAPRFRFVVSSTGNVPLSNVALTDDVHGAQGTWPLIAETGSIPVVIIGTWAAGQHTNVATVTASFTDSVGNTVSLSDTDAANYLGTVPPAPSISLETRTNGEDADTPPGPSIPVGAPVQWTYVVTNTGNVALANVAVTDDRGVTVTAPKTILEPGESMTATASGMAVAGQYANIGTATGTPPSGPPVTASDPGHYFGVVPAIGVTVEVSGDWGATWQDANDAPGPYLEQVPMVPQFRYTIANTGNVPLLSCEIPGVATFGPLNPGMSRTEQRTYAWAAGQQFIEATAIGTYDGQTVTDTDRAYYFGAAPAISIEALTNGEDADTPPGPSIPVGGMVQWTYVVTNTGNVALANVAVTDDRGVTVTAPKTSLAPGESMTATASGTAVAGQYANVGTATGTPPGGPAVTASDPGHYLGVVPPVASFDANVTSGVAPLAVLFTDTSSSGITGRTWDFGDGTPISTETNPVHTYATAGTYTVSLTVTNATGSDGEVRTDFIVVSPPATVDPLAPVFSANVTSGPVPLAVQFTDETTSWTPQTRSWDFGDGGWSDEQNPVHTYAAPGTYTVKLGLHDLHYSRYTEKVDYITVTGEGLVADFDANVTSGVAPLAVLFTDTSTGPIAYRSWDFGDGFSAIEPTYVHTFTTAGTFTVTLTVVGPGGSDSTTRTVQVSVSRPEANFTWAPAEPKAGEPIQFTDTSDGSPQWWSWTFGDGTAASSERNPVHTYRSPGNYTVLLTAYYPGSEIGRDIARTVSVGSRPWIAADFETNVSTGSAPLAVQFTDTSKGGVYYWAWEFGDGTTSTERNPVHTFAAPGTYTVRLLISNFQTTDIRQQTLTVTEAPAPALPVAGFEANVTTGPAPLAVQFTDTSVGDGITARAWHFGDGATSTDPNPVHVYTAPWSYAVTLTVTNAAGQDVEVKAGYVSVMPAGPPPGGSRGYFLVSTEPAGAEIYLEDISGARSLRGNTTAGPLNVSICLTCVPVRKIVANLTGYGDAVYEITQYPEIDGTVPVLLTLVPLATPTPTPTPGTEGPYPGPHALPAVVQAEDYDLGGEGVAYRDIEPANLGGVYRHEGVDIETVGGVTDVGWIRAGESLAYSVDAAVAGSYPLTLRAANPDATAKPVAVYLDGVRAGQVLVGPTGAWTAYSDFVGSAPLEIPAGRHVVTLAFEGTGRINLDWLRLGAGPAPTVTTTTPTTTTPAAGGASFAAAPLSAPKGAAVKFTVIPAAGKSIRSAWWSFDAPAHLQTWNSRAVNPTFFYPRAGTFSPLVRLVYTDGTTEEVHRVGYVRAT